MSFSTQVRLATRTRRGILTALMLLGLVVLASSSQAQTVVYDNGTFTIAIAASRMSDSAVADDFTVTSPTSFNGIRFWAVDNSFSLFDNFSGDLTWYIYEGSAGSPSPNAIPSITILSQGTVSGSDITITDTGSLLLGNPRFAIAQLDFLIPTQNLVAGTYWLRLKEGTDSFGYDGSPILWIRTGATIGNGFRLDDDELNPTTWDRVGTSTTTDFAFQLTSAPEPGTLALLALGIAGGLVARRRK